MEVNSNSKVQFRIEFVLALIITGLACAAGFSNYLFTPNSLYPGATDFLGHMTKIQYITQCLKEGVIPSWFPYWYCGTAVNQYYPPLSYYFMAPIYAITGNVMLTFKINCFLVLFSSGMGIWYYCRSYIGRWCGFFGILTFCLQPYILQTLYGQGQVAQGPVIALTPWYLILILSFGRKPSAVKFMLSTVVCALMILSHPNSIFMYSICIFIALLIFLSIKKISFLNFIYIGLTIIFAGIMTAFWSLIGVTGLENPTIPYLLGEAVKVFSATTDWFLVPTNFFYFAIPMSIGSISALLVYMYNVSRKRDAENESYYILFCIILTAVSIVFSFGLKIPVFEYLPMAENFVAGRILCLTSITAAVLCAYLLYGIQSLSRNKKMYVKVFSTMVCLVIIAATVINMNPLEANYYVRSEDSFRELFSAIDSKGTNFEKGRYTFIGPFDCSQTYFPFTYGFNLSEGYNIEGTPQNRAIWDQIVANSSNNYDYMAKNLAYWNVRYVLLDGRYSKVQTALSKRYPFIDKNKNDSLEFYACDTPSSYFLRDNRNALILGAGAPGVAMEYPYLIYEQRNNLYDYTLNELEKYQVIYLCEPEVNTLEQKNKIEKMISTLVDRGIKIIIEPANTNSNALFDVEASDMQLENSPVLEKHRNTWLTNSAEKISVEKGMNYARVLFGLDAVFYKLVQNDGRLENDIIGTKNVGNDSVLFIGMHLSQNLKGVYARNWGAPASESGYPQCSEEIKTLIEDIFTSYGVNKNFWPDPFPVLNSEWNYKGVDFEYSSPRDQQVTISVTYTPRWKATIDGRPIRVEQRENLIRLDLPAGNHQVKMVYGLTKYGIAGYIISLGGLLVFILFLKFYDIILYRSRQIILGIDKYLQLNHS